VANNNPNILATFSANNVTPMVINNEDTEPNHKKEGDEEKTERGED